MKSSTVILNDIEEIINSEINWNLLVNKTVLISGASGFLASYIVKSILHYNSLKKANITVICIVRNINKSNQIFEDYLNSPNIKFIESDIVDFINYDSDIDYIIHSASQASPKFYGVDPVGTINANTVGTLNLLKIAKAKNVKSFLYFSSGEVYGIVDQSKIPIKENDYGYIDPSAVRSCYAESKRLGENLCIAYSHQYGINVKIVRPFHTYGPAMSLDDGRVFADFVSNIVHKKDIVLNSDGKARRAYCYQSDATVAFFKILLDAENQSVYNMGNPDEEFSVLELANLICGIKPEYNLNVKFNSEYKESNDYLSSPIVRNSPNIDKIKNELNWTPKISAQEGFTRTINSFLENK